MRRRVYVAHFSKPLSRTILNEIQEEYGEYLTETAQHRFRNEGKDISTIFLHHHWVMERHREVLLESYLVHRSDANGDGNLDVEERRVMYEDIQRALKERVQRKSIEEQLNGMVRADLPQPIASQIVWPSTDGYPYSLRTPSNPMAEDDLEAPNAPTYHTKNPPHRRLPTFDFVEMCLTHDFISEKLSDVNIDTRMLFRLLAKEYPYCGDALLYILIPQTPIGLSHLLPSPSHPKYTEVTRNLHKYAYTLAETTSEFIMAKSTDALQIGFRKVLRNLQYRHVAQFCVNDDVEMGDAKTVAKMDRTLKGILQGWYGGYSDESGRSPVEKDEGWEEINEEGRLFWDSVSQKGGPGYEPGVVVS